MIPDNRQPDQSIDRTLTALRSAAPPEGMEARIADRLAARGVPHSSRLGGMSGILAALLPQSAWLRGALTGAVAASLAFAALLFATHLTHPHPSQSVELNSPALKGRGFSRAVSATQAEGALAPESISPCAPPLTHAAPAILSRVPHSSRGLLRDEWEEQRRVPHPSSAWVGTATTTSHAAHLIPASFAPSHPAPPAPLTAQERALVQLVRTATPAELAALNPATQEKADADREAAFQKFFAPPPEPPAADKPQNGPTDADNTTPPQPTEVQN